MSFTNTVSQSVSLGGLSFSNSVTFPSEGNINFSVDVAGAKEGVLSTRTDANTGVLTMATGHGITTAAKLDVYWDGGSRYNMTVGTVATNSVPIDGGSGDDLPVATTVITAMVPVEHVVEFDGDDILGLGFQSVVPATIVFRDSSGPTDHLAYVVEANQAAFWYDGNGITNPVAGDTVDVVALSHGSTSQQTLTGTVAYS